MTIMLYTLLGNMYEPILHSGIIKIGRRLAASTHGRLTPISPRLASFPRGSPRGSKSASREKVGNLLIEMNLAVRGKEGAGVDGSRPVTPDS